MTPDLSLILACYNEVPHLRASVSEIFRELDRARIRAEFIFVDDGSKDETPEVIRQIAQANHDRVIHTVFHAHNRGRGAALNTGIARATGPIAGYIDVDIEIHPACLGSFIRATEEGADLAIARRQQSFRESSLLRIAASRSYNWLTRRALRLPFRDTEGGCKFWRRDSFELIRAGIADAGWFWDTQLVAEAWRAKLCIVEIPCTYTRRNDKKSTVRLPRDTWRYLVCLRNYARHLRSHAAPSLPARAAVEDPSRVAAFGGDLVSAVASLVPPGAAAKSGRSAKLDH